MIGAGAIIVKEWKIGALGVVDRNNTRTISNKSDLKEHACTVATVKDPDCEKLIDEKIPDNDDGLKLGAEAARVAGRDAYRNKQPGATKAVNRFKTILVMPEAWRAGALFQLDRRTTRKLFGDSDSYVKTGTALGGTNITSGTTTLAAALQAAKGQTPPPPPAGKAVAASPAEFDADGNRKKSEVAPKEESESSAVTGSLELGLSPSVDPSGNMGYLFKLKPKGSLYHGPKFKLNWDMLLLAQRVYGIPTESYHAIGKSSAGKATNVAHVHGKVEGEYPLSGHQISLPKVNVLATNDIANQLEKIMVDRWGEKAARIYLDSVVYPHMAKAKDINEMTAAWELVVTKGAKVFEDTLKDPKSTPAVDLPIVKLFEQDPNGLIDLLALLSGETEQAASQKAFKDVKTFASVGQSKYEFSKDAQGKTLTSSNPAEFKPTNPTNGQPMWELLAIVDKDKLVAKAEDWKSATGKDDAKLKAIADRNKVANPFEKDKIPNNPWAAQKLYNDFVAAAGEELKSTKSNWFWTLGGGFQDLNPWSDEASVVASLGLKYNPSEDLTVGAKAVFSPAAIADIIAEDPSIGGGTAYAVSVEGEWAFWKTEEQWYRETKISGGVTYSDGEQLPENLALALALESTFGLTENVTLTPSFEGNLGFDREGDADQMLLIGALSAGFKLNKDSLIALKLQYKHFEGRNTLRQSSDGLSDALTFKTGPENEEYHAGIVYENKKNRLSLGTEFVYSDRVNFTGNDYGSTTENIASGVRFDLSLKKGF